MLREGFEVRGRVVDEARNPIPNARVYASQCAEELPPFEEDQPATAVTDEAGAFVIASAIGMHRLLVVDDDHAPTRTLAFDVDRAIADLEIVMKPGAVYAGSVVASDGTPVANARVYIDTRLVGQRFTGTSDANGAFEIRGLPPTIGWTGRSFDNAVAYAVSDAGVSDEAEVRFAGQPQLREQRLTLTRTNDTREIAGVVVDDTGAPIADVVVNAAAIRPRALLESRSSLVDNTIATSTRTNARGEFALRDLPAGDYGLWPGPFDRAPWPPAYVEDMPGRDPSAFMVAAKPGDHEVRLVKPRPARITGTIVFADTGESVGEFTTFSEITLLPGERGALDLRNLKPGTYHVMLTGAGHSWTKRLSVQVEAGETVDVGTIEVQRGRTVTGKVVDAAGRGVAGASVLIGHHGGFTRRGRFDEPIADPSGATTEADGAFQIAGWLPVSSRPSWAYAVGADHPTYGRAHPIAMPPGTEDPPPLTLTLLACGSIAGRLTRDGQPLVDATIDTGMPAAASAHGNADGEFVLPRVPAGTVALRISAWTDAQGAFEMLRAHERIVEVEAGKQTAVAFEIPIGTITLSVVVSPAPGAEVTAVRLYLLKGTVAFENYAQLAFSEGIQGRVDREGDANRPAGFERLLPGDYTVCAMPLAGSAEDQTLMGRVQRNRAAVKVYCTPVRVDPELREQQLAIAVPAMAPLPP
ncbi:MAG TPA: hypothetical protein VG871_00230 [Vicinamibacterales bacterium]|nr:hypothetical protein [Vicinamibacterales bacterium]